VSHAIAASLGHGSFSMTARHYAQPEVVRGATTSRMVDMLSMGGGAQAPSLDAEQLLSTLPEDLLNRLVELYLKKNR
jgi:hypothetical protein